MKHLLTLTAWAQGGYSCCLSSSYSAKFIANKIKQVGVRLVGGTMRRSLGGSLAKPIDASGSRRAHNHSRFPSHPISPRSCSIHYNTCCLLRADNRMPRGHICCRRSLPSQYSPGLLSRIYDIHPKTGECHRQGAKATESGAQRLYVVSRQDSEPSVCPTESDTLHHQR
jgi:hypothetical protein